MEQQHLTLESVQSDFHQWRINKASVRSRIPDSLKQKAVSLLVNTKPGKITKALNISSAMLRSWSSEPLQNSNPDTVVDFIPLLTGNPSTTSNDTTLTVTQSNGNQWNLHGNITESQLGTFVRELITSGERQ
tara:strand:+ start:140 stop:535 length:396 start_codon:yes stop_codon:yes gene_type:complete